MEKLNNELPFIYFFFVPKSYYRIRNEIQAFSPGGGMKRETDKNGNRRKLGTKILPYLMGIDREPIRKQEGKLGREKKNSLYIVI